MGAGTAGSHGVVVERGSPLPITGLNTVKTRISDARANFQAASLASVSLCLIGGTSWSGGRALAYQPSEACWAG